MTKTELPSIIHDLSAEAGPWAMNEVDLMSLLERGQRVFERSFAGVASNTTALEAYKAARAERGKRLGVRGSVGILYVHGPLVKRESWISGLLGLTCYETLRRDLQVMLDEPRLKSLLLHVDSPGGEVNGCSALAEAIYDARKKKPVTAFVSGQACSAGYWIASAAGRIAVSDLAMLGSIGVSVTITDTTKRDIERGLNSREFVSSVSPKKRPDPNTDVGRATIQKMVDDLADVFVKSVARYRGVSPQTVIERFGRGGIEVGKNAVSAGLADEVGQFEGVLASMQSRSAVPRADAAARQSHSPATAAGKPIVSAPPSPTAEEQARVAAAAEADRKARISAMWKAAADRVNDGLGPHAVKSEF